MPKQVLQQFESSPDMGDLKREPGEYQGLQNVRGWGGLGSKRRGVQSSVTLDYGVMGIFDLQNDGDPTSLDKIIVVDNNGDITSYDFSELTTIFDYLFDTSVQLAIQSPDLNWWDITPNTTTGIVTPTVIATPSSTISTSLELSQNETLGFLDSTGVWRLSISGNSGTITTQRYGLASSATTYTTIQAFTNGNEPIFTDQFLTRWKMSIDNSGLISTTAI
jgi:hypothetical protein